MALNTNLFNLLWLLQTLLSTALKQQLSSATHFTEGLESSVVATHIGNLLSNYVNRFKQRRVQIFFFPLPENWLPDHQIRIESGICLQLICHKSQPAKHSHLPSFSSPLDYAKNNNVFCWRGEWLCTAFLPHTKSDISSNLVLLKGNEQVIQLSPLWPSSTWTVKGQSGKHKLFPLCCKEWSIPRTGWATDTGEENPQPMTRQPGKNSLRKKQGRNLKIKFQIILQATNLFQFLPGKPKAQMNWS